MKGRQAATTGSSQVEAFERDGLVVLGQLLAPGLVQALNERLGAELERPPTPERRMDLRGRTSSTVDGGLLTMLFGWWSRQQDLVGDANRTIIDWARRLLGVEVELLSDETFVKPAGHGAQMEWHQDYAVYADDPRPFLTCWVALNDVTVANGAVQVTPGSHHLGRFVPPNVAHGRSPGTPAMLRLVAEGVPVLPTPGERGLPVCPMTMPAGACSFHHSLLWHRSGPNETAQPRAGVALRYRQCDR